MGAQVKNTDSRRKDFLPHVSERAPMRGAERKERIPYDAVPALQYYTSVS